MLIENIRLGTRRCDVDYLLICYV